MESVKSILVTQFGGYESLKVTDYSLKKPQKDEIEVNVHYCGLNFADLYTRQGLMSDRELPFVLGMECSGIISALGPMTDKFKIGQKVVCYDYRGGMFRHKIVISVKNVYTVPDDVNLENAAAFSVNYLTAYFSLMQIGNLQPKQHVLINSCAGGVGWACTQLASLVDDVVIYGTTSPLKTKLAKGNGVNYVLSYDNLEEQIRMLCPNGLDLIIDNQAGSDFTMKKQLLKSFGKIVFIGSNEIIQNEKKISMGTLMSIKSDISLTDLIMGSISVSGLHLGLLAENESILFKNTLDKLFDLLIQGKIRPAIESIWSFEEIVEATKRLQQRENVGKVLLKTGQV